MFGTEQPFFKAEPWNHEQQVELDCRPGIVLDDNAGRLSAIAVPANLDPCAAWLGVRINAVELQREAVKRGMIGTSAGSMSRAVVASGLWPGRCMWNT